MEQSLKNDRVIIIIKEETKIISLFLIKTILQEDFKMARLVKCSLCGRDVSSEAKACPGCGHDVAGDMRKKEYEQKEKWKKQGLCGECGNAEFNRTQESFYNPIYRKYDGYHIYAKCIKCGWVDSFNGIYKGGQHSPDDVCGRGLQFGSRKLRK
jgi:hypothetical protein